MIQYGTYGITALKNNCKMSADSVHCTLIYTGEYGSYVTILVTFLKPSMYKAA